MKIWAWLIVVMVYPQIVSANGWDFGGGGSGGGGSGGGSATPIATTTTAGLTPCPPCPRGATQHIRF